MNFIKSNARWLAAGILLTFTSGFGQTYFIALFAGEIQGKFGLSHGEWGWLYLLGTCASAVAMIWAGALTDFFRVRILGPLTFLLLAISCAMMATISVVWVLPIVIFLLRFAGQGMATHISAVAMSRWFTVNRGKALAISGLGFSFGEGFLPMIFVALMAVIYWQNLWFVAAILSLLAIPALLFCLTEERNPRQVSEEAASVGMNGIHWTRKLAINHWLFWVMVPAVAGQSAFGTAFFFHQVHFASISGLTHLQFTAFIPIFPAVGISTMVLCGLLLDRFGTPRLIPFYQVPMIVAFFIFGTTNSIWGLALGIFFMGVSSGANATLPNAFWAEFYGTKGLGSIKAAAAAVMVFGSAIGPFIIGYGIDFGVGIKAQYIGVALWFFATTIIVYIGVGIAKRQLPTTPKVNI